MGAEDLNGIRLLNFASNEVDSIAIETYLANSNFTTRIDNSYTIVRSRGVNDTNLIIFLPKKLNIAHKYQVTMLSTGQVYEMTNFTSRKEECNCPNDKYDVLESYSVNGL